MRADACLYLTPEPLTSPYPVLKGLCTKRIQKPEIVPSWDGVPMNTKLDPEQLVGICARCIRKLKKVEVDGTHLLYAVREKTEEKKR